MAIVKKDAKASMVLHFEDNGVKSTKTVNSVNPAVTDAGVYAVGTAMSGLQTKSLSYIERVDKATVENQA